MVYDSARGRTVLFGGSDEGYPVALRYTDTWELVTTTVPKADQTITFLPLADRVFGAPFAVSATASSGLPVTLTAAGPCTISGSTVTMTGGGICSITASQSGTADFNPAAPVTRAFNITCFPSQMVFALPGDPEVVPATLVFTSQQPAPGGCAGTFELKSIGLDPTTVGTGTFTATTAGGVAAASLSGSLVPPFNTAPFTATLTLGTATQAGTLVEVFATQDGLDGLVTITATFAKSGSVYVLTGAMITP
jgi:hypothetical protein